VLKDGSVEWLERRPSGGWAHFMTIPVGDVDGTRLEELSYDGKTLYYFESRGRDKSALMAMDVATRKARMLAEDPNADIKDVLLDKLTYRPLAASATYQRQNWQAVEPGFAPHLKAMRAATKGEIWFASLIDDRSKALAYVDRSDGGPEYAIYDRNRRAMRTLFKLRPALEGLPLRPMEAVTVKARDGLPIPCYLTLPESGARNVPMVMAIHGGPYWRDTWGYNSTHQWLANRGYAVLNVNFRGSTGFGKKFVTAADGEWGGKMHDDLMDARAWAVAQSIADPNKIAFYGASYGGYAALTAATKTPESFTCIVDIFGIANLITFMAAIPPYWKPWFPV
jgi:dipeptidyl aminopeptidase/acylaminoacyl peptidase